MKLGSVVYFRDYGLYDQAQLRFAEKKKQKLGENFYVRQDKTRAYYFSLEEVEKMFREAGFEEVIENVNHYRLIENRKKGLKMHRVWVQAKFRKTRNVELLLAKADREYEYEKFLKEHKQTAEELIEEAKQKREGEM